MMEIHGFSLNHADLNKLPCGIDVTRAPFPLFLRLTLAIEEKQASSYASEFVIVYFFLGEVLLVKYEVLFLQASVKL